MSVRRYTAGVHRDLAATFARDLHKWLVIAPVLGGAIGLVVTLVASVILRGIWPAVLAAYLRSPLLIVPGLAVGFTAAGLLMQYATPDPNEHSTEEVIRAYHERDGEVDMSAFVPKLLAAIATVGAGGSAALEGPGIYGGGALGSWTWRGLRRLHGLRLEARDRRIMLISGAAAGMAAVFRAPLTGIVFALEMPYKDDLAHEAVLPSLIASVASYVTLVAFLGADPIFDFPSGSGFTGQSLAWSALLGLVAGGITLVFSLIFQRVRAAVVRARTPHVLKMAVGGVATGLCGVAFLTLFPGALVPIGPNYEAVPDILLHAHSSLELVTFGAFKLIATVCTLGVGGVSAMFVPLFLSGAAFGRAFAQSIVHTSGDLYAAVGMAAFIAGGYKTPLAAAVFVAEATGGHAYIVPALVGAAVAYAVSGDASVSAEQRVHERAARQPGEAHAS